MIGELATSKAGHDKDRLYMIVGEEGECVYLCDGRLRGVEHPKKKKKKHIQIIHSSAQDTLIQIIKQNLPGERDEIDRQIRLSHPEGSVACFVSTHPLPKNV